MICAVPCDAEEVRQLLTDLDVAEAKRRLTAAGWTRLIAHRSPGVDRDGKGPFYIDGLRPGGLPWFVHAMPPDPRARVAA